jgi:hypothetical protein
MINITKIHLDSKFTSALTFKPKFETTSRLLKSTTFDESILKPD